MNDQPRNKVTKEQAREERLAAQLRENLRRRKAQSRAMARAPCSAEGESPAQTLSKPGADS